MKFLTGLLLFLGAFQLSAQDYYDVDWQYSGQIASEAFGWSMSQVGDVNGDGYPDLLISAIDHSDPLAAEEEEGKIYLFYGGPEGLSSGPVWSYEPNETLNITGFDVSGGDINGDGYSDIAVGCLQWSGDQTEEGKVILFYGSASGPADTPDWTVEGDQDDALMGSSVALTGDINSDGYNDLFVSAKMYDEGEIDEGKVWLFYGSADGPVPTDWFWEPNQDSAIGGFPVRYAGDINGDGFDDIIIGANNYSTFYVEDGLAVAFYGSADGLSLTPDWQATGGQAKCGFGHWVDGAGDVNGDGYDDVIVAAILYESDFSEFNEGWVFAFYGSASGLLPTASWTSEGNQTQAQYGYSIAGAGDINNDGYSDVVIGAKYWEETYTGEGAAFLFFGSSTGLDNDYCWKKFGGQLNGYLGKTVAGGSADYNNDGYDDFLVSAYRYTNILPTDGIAYCIYGQARESDFTYAANQYCIYDSDPTADILGLEGGTFSASAGLIFSDASTGQIDISSTPPGIYQIYYTYDAEFCSSITSFQIEISSPEVNGMFAYPNDTVNISSPNPSPYFFAGATAGEFSATPEGLVFADISTGEINLTACIPGTYTVSNTVYDALCGDITYDFVITIAPTCIKPEAPLISDITETSATVQWNAVEYATTYDLYLSHNLDTTAYEGLTDTTFTFTDLLSGSLYKVWVSAHCDYKSSPKSDKTNFTTGGTSVENNLLPENSITLSPIPAQDAITINSTHIAFQYITIYNTSGQKCTEVSSETPLFNCTLNIENWNQGVYVVIISGSNYQLIKYCIILQ